MSQTKTYRLINSRTVFGISMIVVGLTVTIVYLEGLGQHRTLFANTLISTTVLSLAFFGFITLGLFFGLKLKDTLGKITDRVRFSGIKPREGPDFLPEVGEGLVGIVLGILLWIVVAVVLSVVLSLFGHLFLLTLATLVAMLYWIFFRALRLVFRNSRQCKGRWWKSIRMGLTYTLLYNGWIYLIVFLTHFF